MRNLFIINIFILYNLIAILFKQSSLFIQADLNDIYTPIRFTNDSYTGYISENIAQLLNPSSSSSSSSSVSNYDHLKRHNQLKNTTSNRKTIYVRFVDELKPSISFKHNQCSQIDLKKFNLTLNKNEPYDESDESLNLFEIDYNSYLCTKIDSNCLCYIKIRLTDDPFVRDRINREAKDSYQFYLKLNNSTTNINVNILDDNDLEPMFDPSDYLIELNEFKLIESDRFIIRDVLPEFSVIGRVFASDPDLGQNAKVKFYSTNDPFYGVNPLTGDIFLKKNLNYLFELNYTEFDFEVKAIDSGVKSSLLNNLIKSMPVQNSSFMDLDELNRKLVRIGAHSIDQKTILNNQLSQQTSFESARVKIILKKNLNNLIEQQVSSIHLEDLNNLDNVLLPDSNSIPFKYLKLKFINKNLNFYKLKIESNLSNNKFFDFNLKKVRADFYLIYFKLNDEIDLVTSLEKLNISLCIDNDLNICAKISEFKFDIINDFISSINNLCSLEVTLAGLPYDINRFTPLNKVLFKPKPTFKPNNPTITSICEYLSSFKDLFRIENLLTGFQASDMSILVQNVTSGSFILVNTPQTDNLYKLSSNMYLNKSGSNIRLNLSCNRNISLKYSNKYDSISNILNEQIGLIKIFFEPTKTVIYDSASSLEQISIEKCEMVKRNGTVIQSEPCYLSVLNNQVIFNENMIDTFQRDFKHVLLSIRVKTSDSLIDGIKNMNYLIINEYENRIYIRLSAPNRKSSIQSQQKNVNSNILENAVLIAKLINSTNQNLSLNVLNDSIDNKCFMINQLTGDLYLKCKLPFSFLNQNLNKQVKNFKYNNNKFLIDLNSFKRVLQIKNENINEITTIEVVFDIMNQLKKLDDILIDVEPINYSFINNQLINTKTLNDYRNRLKNIKDEYQPVTKTQSPAIVTGSNDTFLSLSYKIHNSSDCSINSLIFKFDSNIFPNLNKDNFHFFELIESENDIFKVEKITGELKFNDDFRPAQLTSIYQKFRLKLNITETDLMKYEFHIISVDLILKFELNNLDMFDLPTLIKSNFYLKIDLSKIDKTKDLLLISSFHFRPVLTDFNITYSIKQTEIGLRNDLPFYIDPQSGQLFYFNGLKTEKAYKFQILLTFKFNLNEKLVHTQVANVKLCFLNGHINTNEIKLVKNENKNMKKIISTFNLNTQIQSTDLFMYSKSPLIGFVTISDDLVHRYEFDLDKPKFKLVEMKAKKNKKLQKKLIDKDFNEKEFLNENFVSLLKIDEDTGALYFNTKQDTSLSLFSKISKLINYYYYEQNMNSKMVKIEVLMTNQYHNISDQFWINLILNQNETNFNLSPLYLAPAKQNNFKINSNNLLNIFRNGDEFLINIELEENSPTWLSLIDSSQREEGFIINLKEYFKSKLNDAKKSHLIYLNLLKNLKFYIFDENNLNKKNYFQIDDNSNGILLTKQSVQFDYEINHEYLTKILIIQSLDEIDDFTEQTKPIDRIDRLDDLVFESNKNSNQQEQFHYFIDLNIKILNIVDEPFTCSEPVYYVDVDENEVKNKKLFTIKIIDYDQNDDQNESKYISHILSGNAQGLFSMDGLSLYTGSSARKLDRETRAQHELDIKIIEMNENDKFGNENLNSSRFALCKIIATVNDINDNRPIVNDIDLMLYDKLDTRLIDDLKVPIANAIAIDQDQISKLTYSIISVQIADSTEPSKRDTDVESIESETQNNDELSNLFYLNSSTGALYTTKTDLPCHDCMIQIQYKATDIGRLKTRVSRKSSIKLSIRKFPITLFKLNDNGRPQVEKLTPQELESLSLDQNRRTFELAFKPNKSSNIIVLNLSEDVKLGEKIYQIKTKSKLIIEKSIIYYNLIDSSNFNQTFYLSNHDGSLYLIKPLDYENKSVSFFNLTVLITNWLGQIEYVYLEINVKDSNDNRPRFQSTLIDLNEVILIDNLKQSKEKYIDLMNAYDSDELDYGKLSFKLEDCFYMGHNLLLKKPYVPSVGINPSTNYLNYPLCSKQFIELQSVNELNYQKVKLKIKLNEFNDYFTNSSDFYQSDLITKSGIIFIMDLSVKDTSILSPSIARVKLNISLERSDFNETKLVFKRNQFYSDYLTSKTSGLNEYSTLNYGFKKDSYFVAVKSHEQLEKGNILIRLINEFVWSDTESPGQLNPFKPYELNFFKIKKFNDLFNDSILIDSNFGFLYLNKTVLYSVLNNNFILEIEIGCEVKSNNKFLRKNLNSNSQKFFKTTKVYLSMFKSILNNLISLDDLLTEPIWTVNQTIGFIDENESIGSRINLNLKQLINYQVLSDIQKLTPVKLEQSHISFQTKSELFNLEPMTGILALKFEPDYESVQNYTININICLNNLDLLFSFKTQYDCFRQSLIVLINVNNKNDNEPKLKLISNSDKLDLNNPGDLIRSMSFFKFESTDLDGDITDHVSYELARVINHQICSNITDLINVDSFELFKLDDQNYVVKLTDLGFENLIRISNKHCDAKIELVCQLNDGLFTNQIIFNLNFNLDQNLNHSSILSIKNNLIAPILHTIEINENIVVTQGLKLINLEDLIENYLNINSKSTYVFEFELLNYENLFSINETDLIIRKNAILDRETRDTFELFISVKAFNHKNKINSIPSRIRILVKLNDLNDNHPIFVKPIEVKYTNEIKNGINMFYYNRTVLLEEFLASNESNPILKVEAIDQDIGLNSQVNYLINYTTDDIFSINKKTGSIFYNLNHAKINTPYNTRIIIIAKDNVEMSKESALEIRFNFVQNDGVYFEQNFYYFKLVESFEVNKTIGYVSSAKRFKPKSDESNIIYSIIDDNDFQEFKIDFKTGRLFLAKRIDYEFKSSYLLSIKAVDCFDLGLNSIVRVKIDLIDINDHEPKFDKFEYYIEIEENIPRMSVLYRLNATDLDSANSYNSRIHYKLLNHLDLFYINEVSGLVYNKQTFDFETSQKIYQLKIKAYDLGNVNENQTFVSKSLDTTCLLTIKLIDSNDNPPEFEKSLVFTQIELDSDLINDQRNLIDILLDDSSPYASNITYEFVTKVNAKDVDQTNQLEYSIIKQTYLSNEQHNTLNYQLITQDLFIIDSKYGIVYLNKEKFKLFQKFNDYLINQISVSKTFGFNLHLQVSDSKFSSQSRLNIQIKPSNDNYNSKPVFRTSFNEFSFDISNKNLNRLIDLRDLLENQETHQIIFSINLDTQNDLLFIEDSFLGINITNLRNESCLLEVPILACDKSIETGLCDQTILLINFTSHTNKIQAFDEPTDSLTEKSQKVGFLSSYGVFTTQQQFSTSNDYQEAIETNDDDYYMDDGFESNERFYYELKTIDLSLDRSDEDDLSEEETKKSKNQIKYDFEILACNYINLNMSLSNSTLAKQIKQFTQSKSYISLTSQQIKPLFSLNKHNGVLSSRKIINYMLPGIYLFNISLRLMSKQKNETTMQIDSTQFKLIILPSTTSLKNSSKYLSNNFKFDKEFYKFKFNKSQNNLGTIKLVQKLSKNDESKGLNKKNMIINYELINNNKFKTNFDIETFFDLNRSSGELIFKDIDSNKFSPDFIRSFLNEDNILILHALATVKQGKSIGLSLNQLEYMTEIHIDFNYYINNQKEILNLALIHKQDSKIDSLRFGKKFYKLTFNENLKPNTDIFRLVCLTGQNLNEQRLSLIYKIESEQTLFTIDPRAGVLKLLQTLNKQIHKDTLKLNISSCLDKLCAYTNLIIDLVDTNNNPPTFELKFQNRTIREDALPGTVVATLNSKDLDQIDGSKLEYFIISGDELNQFAISSDGKVYTRLMLDKELISNYTLSIIVFDGKFKSLTRLYITVLNVDDSRPVCVDNYVNLNLTESLKIGNLIYKIKSFNPDSETSLRYELLTEDQIGLLLKPVYEFLPFIINEKNGEIRLNEALDYEFRKHYKFYVRVFKPNEQSDIIMKNRVLKSVNGHEWLTFCLIKFDVEILDENDNKPEFNLKMLKNEINLIEHSRKETILGVYDAIDSDSKQNSVISYSLVDKNDLFKIDKSSGLVQLNTNELDRETLGDSINLKIRASNYDNLSSDFDLKILINDLNDHKPKFEQNEYFISLQENLPLGSLITELTAIDLDHNSSIEYYLKSSSDSDKFTIDKHSGRIYLNTTIDYETKNQYILDIIAVDPELIGENSSSTRLLIDIIDLNDNPPVFDPSIQTDLDVSENIPLNSTIIQLNATDKDKTSKNNILTYRVIEGFEYFEIEPNTGRLYNKVEFDYESIEVKEFNIKIECSDNGDRESLRTVLDLKVHIRDLNDNEPVFTRKNQTLVLKESYPLGQEITKFQVTDLDQDDLFTFTIMEQFKSIDMNLILLTEPFFAINPNGSLILIKRPFKNQTYIIKVRCYDSGQPTPLYSDTYLIVIITDESNNEPKMSDQIVEIITIDDFVTLRSDQIIGELKASDPDRQDTIFYEINDPYIEVNQLNGLLKLKSSLPENSQLNLKPTVTDKKFTIESNLNILTKKISLDCLVNSLYAKFSVLALNDSVNIEKFINLGYLKRIKETVQRLLIPQFKNSNLTIEIIGLREDNLNDKELHEMSLLQAEEDETNSNNDKTSTRMIEILLNVQSNKRIECLNSKYISKILNKKKSVLSKRLNTNKNFNINLLDLSFNHECLKNPSQICSTNMALQNCELKLNGYNKHNLCEEQTNKCFLIPKHDWTCENFSSKKFDSTELDFDSRQIDLITSTKVIETRYGSTCKKNINPCKNSGICKIIKSGSVKKLNMTKTRIHCFCPDGFKGKYCENDINECSESDSDSASWISPCQSSATCINTYGSYTCNCTLQPSSLCYNTQSKYTASTLNLINVPEVKNLKYINSFKKFDYLNSQDDFIDLDDNGNEYKNTNEELPSHITLFGTHIPNHIIQQALLGLFGGICAILVLLSLAAGIVCKINLSRSYRSNVSLNHRHHHDKLNSTIGGVCENTSNTSVDHEMFTSSTSSPCSYKMQKAAERSVISKQVNQNNKYKHGRFNRNKQRSSMTASLLSSNTMESGSECTNQRENNRRNFKSLFFSRLGGKNNKMNRKDQVTTVCTQETSSLAEIETSSAYSSQSIENGLNTHSLAKYKLDRKKNLSIVESSCLLETTEGKATSTSDENDADDECCLKKNEFKLNSLVRPVNQNTGDFSSFGRASFKNKFNTLNVKPSCSTLDFDKIKFNTVVNSSKRLNHTNIKLNKHTTFLPQLENENEQKDDSINEDCSLGFYWDITDWAGGIVSVDTNDAEKLNNQEDVKITINSNLKIDQDFSPIYSKVFKLNNKNKIENLVLIEESNFDLNDENNIEMNLDEDEEVKIDEKLKSFHTENYMFLTNKDDCDKTFESTNTNICSQTNEDDKY